MHRENLILFNVLNNEVIFEEYFCNLLQFDKFRNLFLDFINSKNTILDKTQIKYKNFNTEKILEKEKEKEKYGRADLYLEYNNKEYIFEIKNKCHTQLTINQPEGYLDYLKKNNEQLYFLIPRFYAHTDENKLPRPKGAKVLLQFQV